MPTYVALLRAVNLGGTSKLPMAELKAMCAAEGFEEIKTYIASGNVVFTSPRSEPEIKGALERRLQAYAGKPVGVAVRTAKEMAAVLKANPFPDGKSHHTVAFFLDNPPPPDAINHVRGARDEEVRLGLREIYVRYGATGIGRSKLKIPAAQVGTGRNMNTIAKLVELAAAD